MNVEVVVKEPTNGKTNVDDLPPIVLVHGILGFGNGRLGGLSYFAGLEKKDERVLIPDLGSLTIGYVVICLFGKFLKGLYLRARELFYYLRGGQVDYDEEYNKAYGQS
ncbi:hypothetical protein K1719_012077 [Acacia pycnantha]|nr:hypothetical protein K1719_012077 [Acacia pycnantha]